MSARIFYCQNCKTKMLGFESEQKKLFCRCEQGEWKKMPNLPEIVLATSQVMIDYYLDSLNTLHDAEDVKFVEAEKEREHKAYQKAVIEM